VDVDPERNLVYATGCPTVEVIDGGSNTVVATVPVGQWPVDVAVNPAANLIYVAKSAKEGSSIWVIDGTTNTVVATVPVDLRPVGVAVNPNTNLIYVTGGDNVSVIDGGTNTVVANVALGVWNWPQGVAVNPATNRIYVTNGLSGTVSVIDGGANTVVATVPVGQWPVDVAVNPDTNRIYVTGGDNVSVIDGATDDLLYTVPRVGGGNVLAPSFGNALAVNPITSLVYVGVWGIQFDGGGYRSLLKVIDDSPGAPPPPAASPAPPPPTPTACPPSPAPPPADGMEWVPLLCGTCNPNATTYPDSTPIGTIAGAVTPPETLEALWASEGGVWMGYSPQFPAASDLTQVDRLDVVFICVGGSATFTRPVL
jgi:YVTN family beta-propeller protein